MFVLTHLANVNSVQVHASLTVIKNEFGSEKILFRIVFSEFIPIVVIVTSAGINKIDAITEHIDNNRRYIPQSWFSKPIVYVIWYVRTLLKMLEFQQEDGGVQCDNGEEETRSYE